MTNPPQKPKMRVENVSCILPEQPQLGGVFVGNVYGAQNAAVLKEYGIRAVLTTSIQTNTKFNPTDIPFHMMLPAHDKQDYNLRQHINDCIHFIEESRKLTNVYIHCYAGVSRSVAICTAYIMWKFKWDYQTSIAFMKAKRVVAKPNDGFVNQLLQIQKVIIDTSYAQRQQPIITQKQQIQPIQQMYQTQLVYETKQPQQTNPHVSGPSRSISAYQLHPNTHQRYSSGVNMNMEPAEKSRLAYQKKIQNGAVLNVQADGVKVQRDAYDQYYKENIQAKKTVGPRHSDLYMNSSSYRQPQEEILSKPVSSSQQKVVPGQHQQFNGSFYQQNGHTEAHEQHYSYNYHCKLQQQSRNNQTDILFRTGSKNNKVDKISSEYRNFQKQYEIQKSKTNSRLVRQPPQQRDFQENSNSFKNLNQKSGSLYTGSHMRAESSTAPETPNRVLGGKRTYKHNNIPIPRLTTEKGNYDQQNIRDEICLSPQSPPYRSGISSSNRASEVASKPKISVDNYRVVGAIQSPKNNIYSNEAYFAQSDSGFYSKPQSGYSQSRQNSKTGSRCLIRPKDLPGYKK